jgi:hypothetical protein
LERRGAERWLGVGSLLYTDQRPSALDSAPMSRSTSAASS